MFGNARTDPECSPRKYERDAVRYSEPYIAKARLSIFPIETMEWSFRQGFNFATDSELWINNIWGEWTSRRKDDSLTLVMDGVDWKCTLGVGAFPICPGAVSGG